MAKQFWKLPFRKSGYPAETVEVSTIGKIVGDYISVPRTYFQLQGTSINYLDKEDNQYKAASLGTEGTVFLLARNSDEELSESIGITVYTRILLNNLKVANTTLQIRYQPFGDILDPTDFEQSLGTTADVQHKNLLLTEDLTCRDTYATNSTISENITVGRNVNSLSATIKNLTVEKASLGSLSLGEYEMKFTNGVISIGPAVCPHILTKNLNPLKLLTLSPANLVEIYPVEWLQIDMTNTDLVVNGVSLLAKLRDLQEQINELK